MGRHTTDVGSLSAGTIKFGFRIDQRPVLSWREASFDPALPMSNEALFIPEWLFFNWNASQSCGLIPS
jgi:hypothetical protein